MGDTDAIIAALGGVTDIPRSLPFEEAWREWRKAIGMARDRYKGPAKARSGSVQRIAVLSDLHVPFHDPVMLADFIATEGPRTDVLILNGDAGDAHALSRFVKYARIPYRDEWAAVTLVIQALSEAFPVVFIGEGNHDARAETQIRLRLTEDLVDCVLNMTGGTLNPIAAIAKRFENVSMAHHETEGGHDIPWFVTHGDAIMLHAEKYSRVPGAALRSIEEWLDDHRRQMRLPDYRLVVQAHTHQMAWIPWRSDRLLVEGGCMCLNQGYMTSPRIGGRPQRRGYVTFDQYDGRTDLNSVRTPCYDWA